MLLGWPRAYRDMFPSWECEKSNHRFHTLFKLSRRMKRAEFPPSAPLKAQGEREGQLRGRWSGEGINRHSRNTREGNGPHGAGRCPETGWDDWCGASHYVALSLPSLRFQAGKGKGSIKLPQKE